MGWPEPVALAGPQARLEPLSMAHHDALCDAARDGELWKLWYTSVPSPERMAAEIERRMTLPTMCAFTVFDAAGRVAGMTTYMNTDAANKRVEIGSTWTRASAQRSALNTQSRRAIERLGAQLDGILRAHARAADGSLRDTAVYSITAFEWPAVRSHLDWQLAKPR